MGLLTANEYDAIRAAIDVSLDADTLPDRVIELPVYGPAADLWVQTRDPLWASRTGAAHLTLVNALIFYCASLLVPAIPMLTAETHGPNTWQRQPVEWQERAALLRGQAEEAVSSVVTPTATSVAPMTMFGRVAGRRGQ